MLAFAQVIKDEQVVASPVALSQQLSGHFELLQSSLAQNTELTVQGLKAQEEARILQQQLNDKQEEMIWLEKKVLNNHEEMKQMQVKALEQLAVLQSRVQAVLTQTFELHEYPIPRLFIVLPQYPSGWDILEPFTDKYRLYFLCECGEHTKAAGSKNNIPHKIHPAKHVGYEIARPTEFFQHYGPYLLTNMKMLKFGVSVVSVAVPAFAHLLNADALDQAAKGLQHLKDCIEPGMDQVIGKIDKSSEDEGDQVALEGADLRKLETFLKNKDGDKVLGNLYKTVTDEGHVKWLCMDHYRENYNQAAVEAFRRTVESLGGSFDENNGVVKQLYSALRNSRSVHELDIVFGWACTKTDLQALEDALRKSAVAILHVDLQLFRPSLSNKLSSISTKYEVVHRLMDPPNMKSIHIVLPKDLITLSSFTPKKRPHLRKLSFEMILDSGHFDLGIYHSYLGGRGAQALSEALKINSTMNTLNLWNNSIGGNGAQALSEALRTHSTLTTLNLSNNSIGDNGAQALSEALKINSTLTTLNLSNNSIGDNGAQALSEALKTNSTMTFLGLGLNSETTELRRCLRHLRSTRL
ncbi:hypothetical protein BGZ70_002078 [Mortierella alpina]|uniref:RNI-like protein n=1 Tax=Mortierella alpina TaxID=64518 RepID=A0A9P6IVB9_MORAP|nr:hypothetical protein BGZ70_002078 [Mortierella alpina]